MTDPQVQAQADAEQVRLVLEALALRRKRPADETTATAPVVRFFPGGPRPTLAEASGRLQDVRVSPAALPHPAPEQAQVLYRRARRTERGRESGEPALR